MFQLTEVCSGVWEDAVSINGLISSEFYFGIAFTENFNSLWTAVAGGQWLQAVTVQNILCVRACVRACARPVVQLYLLHSALSTAIPQCALKLRTAYRLVLKEIPDCNISTVVFSFSFTSHFNLCFMTSHLHTYGLCVYSFFVQSVHCVAVMVQ